MAKSFKELKHTTDCNGVFKDYHDLYMSGASWDDGIEAMLWKEHWRRNAGIKYLPDFYYDQGRFYLWTETGRAIGEPQEIMRYCEKYPEAERITIRTQWARQQRRNAI